MYCKNCGKFIDEDDRYCSNCGAYIAKSDYDGKYEDYENHSNSDCEHYKGEERRGDCACEEDKPSVGFGILSFFIPLVGLILFITWHKESPKKAKSCLIGMIIGVVFTFITSSFTGNMILLFLEELLASI